MQAARILVSCLAIAGVTALAGLTCAAQPQVVVHVASGRQFKGAIDSASTADRLVLRAEFSGITIRRPIRWERVTAVTADGLAVDTAELRRMAVAKATADSEQKSLPNKIELRESAAVSDLPTADEPLLEETPKVAMVTFDPSIANWDGDVETDGVLIAVAPLDFNGRLLSISGTLEVELFAPQRRTLDLAPQSGGDTLELVERWTRAITPNDFGPSGVRLRLPFGAITPELQPNWTAWHYGLVHVRLAIPGHGVFEDSRDGVLIRPFAPNRDRLEMKTGQRFLSTENLGRRD